MAVADEKRLQLLLVEARAHGENGQVEFVDVSLVPVFGTEGEVLLPPGCQLHFQVVLSMVLAAEVARHVFEGGFGHKHVGLFRIAGPHKLVLDVELTDAVDKFDEGLVGQNSDIAVHLLLIDVLEAYAILLPAYLAIIVYIVRILVDYFDVLHLLSSDRLLGFDLT